MVNRREISILTGQENESDPIQVLYNWICNVFSDILIDLCYLKLTSNDRNM